MAGGRRDGRIWQGVRMRRTEAGADADAPLRPVTLPASWDQAAAGALAALLPGDGPVLAAQAAEAWIRPIAAAARAGGWGEGLGDSLRALLLTRRGAPCAEIWQGLPVARPGFVLNLAAFHHPLAGFDIPGFVAAVETAVVALNFASPPATHLAVGIADLAGLLAALGLEYDSEPARNLAANLGALLRGRADAVSARFAEQATLTSPEWKLPLPCALIPGLTEAVREARGKAALAPHHLATIAVLPPGPVEALLGVETGGIAPAFSPLNDEGKLTRAANAYLVARGLAPERALAALLAGDSLFTTPTHRAVVAMHRALAPYLQALAEPAAPAARPAGLCEPLPARARGYSQQVSLGGHRLVLRTSEYADGRLAELSVSLPKESAALRGLMESFTQALSIGLQHGVPLAAYIEPLALSRFGIAGLVEGDPSVGCATSAVDYVVRHLAASYLGGCDIPEATIEELPPPADPLLPLDLPASPRTRRRDLRMVVNN